MARNRMGTSVKLLDAIARLADGAEPAVGNDRAHLTYRADTRLGKRSVTVVARRNGRARVTLWARNEHGELAWSGQGSFGSAKGAAEMIRTHLLRDPFDRR